MKIITTLLILFTLLSCGSQLTNTTSGYESTGSIVGKDLGMCPCCGNWLITIDDDTTKRQFVSLPEDCTIDLKNATFPLAVKFNWAEAEGSCGFVKIEDIALNK